MRKIFFVAALCVAGLVSANNVKDGKEETKNTQKEVVVSSESGKVVESKANLDSCFPVYLSCGITGEACGSDVPALLKMAWDLDRQICGQANV